MTRVIRGIGWTLVVGGVVVLLYVVYLLWFTGFETQRAQRDLAETWSIQVPDEPEERADLDISPAADPDEPVEPGDAYAAMWFERNGQRIINDEVLYVVEGSSLPLLRAGPGHYQQSDQPGGPGNLAIAGHRTTYGAPFWSLDELQLGDTIHVVDREGREWIYAYREQRVVAPSDVWVVDEDPLETGAPTITLTTCHPRGSARQRLIAWGELLGEPLEDEPLEGEPAAAQDQAEDEELPGA